MIKTLEQHLLAEYEAAYPEGKAASPFTIFCAGYAIGMKNGQKIASDVLEITRDKARTDGYGYGMQKGLSQAAYMASHVSTVEINASMTPAQAAATMRESITAALSLERDRAALRVETIA